MFVFMMTNAGRSDERGSLDSWNDEDVAAALDIDPEDVAKIRESMQGKTLDGTRLRGWEKRQPKREDGAAERAKAWRDQQRTQANASERINGEPNADEPPEAEAEKDTDSEVKAASLRTRPAIGEIEVACRKAGGHESSPAPGFLDVSPILGLIDGGADLTDDILPAIRAKPFARARGWSYYVPQIQDAIARRKAAAVDSIPLSARGQGPPRGKKVDGWMEIFRDSHGIGAPHEQGNDHFGSGPTIDATPALPRG